MVKTQRTRQHSRPSSAIVQKQNPPIFRSEGLARVFQVMSCAQKGSEDTKNLRQILPKCKVF